MHGLDLMNTSVLGALGCDMSVFLRYFPAAETMYEMFVALAIGLILLQWVWGLFKNFGLGIGTEADDPVKLSIRSILFILLAYHADEIVNIVLTIGGKPYDWIMTASLPSLDFGSFNVVLLTIIGVVSNGAVALIVLLLVSLLAAVLCVPAFAITESEVEAQVATSSKGEVAGNVLIIQHIRAKRWDIALCQPRDKGFNVAPFDEPVSMVNSN